MRSPYRSARRKDKPLAEERIQAYKGFRPATEKAGRRQLDAAFVMVHDITIPMPRPRFGRKRWTDGKIARST
jgi:hypothetical protein